MDRLGAEERGQLLTALLAAHPQLAQDAERMALARLAAVDADTVAASVESDLRHADADQLAVRAGLVRGRGYLPVEAAASEILGEVLQPYPDDLRRRAALGLPSAAAVLGLGTLRGLAACQTRVAAGTVLD